MNAQAQTDLDRLFVKQVNLYRLQEAVDKIILGAPRGSQFVLTEKIVKDLHAVAMKDLLPLPGEYRTGPVKITNTEHVPPPFLEVQGHMDAFFKYLIDNWDQKDLVHLSAFAMWRLNWIHPFFNGNGRTARAVSYLVLCAKHGGLLPAKKTIIKQIVDNKKPYYEMHRTVDRQYQKTGAMTCLEPLEGFISFLLKEQIKAGLES